MGVCAPLHVEEALSAQHRRLEDAVVRREGQECPSRPTTARASCLLLSRAVLISGIATRRFLLSSQPCHKMCPGSHSTDVDAAAAIESLGASPTSSSHIADGERAAQKSSSLALAAEAILAARPRQCGDLRCEPRQRGEPRRVSLAASLAAAWRASPRASPAELRASPSFLARLAIRLRGGFLHQFRGSPASSELLPAGFWHGTRVIMTLIIQKGTGR